MICTSDAKSLESLPTPFEATQNSISTLSVAECSGTEHRNRLTAGNFDRDATPESSLPLHLLGNCSIDELRRISLNCTIRRT